MAVAEERLLLLDRRLAALRKSRPELLDAISLQEQLIRADLTSARRPQANGLPLPRERVAARVRDGTPLLHEQPVDIDVHFAADLFSRLVSALQQRVDDPEQLTAPRLGAVVDAATAGVLDPQRLFAEAFVQHPDHLAEIALRAGVDPELLTTLATQAVAPVLRAYAERLMPLVERLDDGSPDGASWLQGYCPVCGGWPLLAELRGVELAQYLRCSGCGHGWRSRRLFCPYCGNDDHRSLGSLSIDGEARFRVAVCERCKGYLKVGNAFDPPPAELLALDDVMSLHLDVAAIERGYRRPGGTGFILELAVPEDELQEEDYLEA